MRSCVRCASKGVQLHSHAATVSALHTAPDLNAFVADSAAPLPAPRGPTAPITPSSHHHPPLLHGWRVAVKANLWVEGRSTDAGSRALSSYVPSCSATAVSRVVAAGAVLASRATNMDAFGMGSSTTHSVHGPTFSPYSVNASAAFAALRGARPAPTSGWLTCGGSSGGSAVAVASGAVRAALGSDTGGSVRQPAAFCGVVGVKPTYGRVSRFGLVPYA